MRIENIEKKTSIQTKSRSHTDTGAGRANIRYKQRDKRKIEPRLDIIGWVSAAPPRVCAERELKIKNQSDPHLRGLIILRGLIRHGRIVLVFARGHPRVPH